MKLLDSNKCSKKVLSPYEKNLNFVNINHWLQNLKELFHPIKYIIYFLITFVVQFWQISFVMSLVRAGLLLILIIMLSSAMIPFAPALEEGISEIYMFSHHRNHVRLLGTVYSLLWLDQTRICQIP